MDKLELSKSRVLRNVLDVQEVVYKVLPDGLHNIRITRAELVESATGKQMVDMKFNCIDEGDDEDIEYSTQISTKQSPMSMLAQLIRAISEKKIKRLKLDDLQGVELTICLKSRDAFQNIVSISPIVIEDDEEESDSENEDNDTEEAPVEVRKKGNSKDRSFRKRNNSEDDREYD